MKAVPHFLARAQAYGLDQAFAELGYRLESFPEKRSFSGLPSRQQAKDLVGAQSYARMLAHKVWQHQHHPKTALKLPNALARFAFDIALRQDLRSLLDLAEADRLHGLVLGKAEGSRRFGIAAFARALGVKVVHIERATYAPDRLAIDPAGLNGRSALRQSDIPFTSERFRKVGAAFVKQFKQSWKARVPSLNRDFIRSDAQDLPPEFVFLPFTSPVSPYLFHSGRLVQSVAEIAELALRLVNETPIPALAFNQHPAYPLPKAVVRRLLAHPKIVNATGWPTNEVLPRASAVVAINGAVGVAALALGRPLYAVGESYYARPEICFIPQDVEDLLATFRKEPHPQQNENETARLAYLGYLTGHYLLGYDEAGLKPRGRKALAHRFLVGALEPYSRPHENSG